MNTTDDQLPPPPRPEPPPEHEPYWQGLREHRLMIQRCTACGTLRHYPRPVCPACYAMDYDWAEVAPRGTVHTWNVSHHPFHPGFKRAVPYATVTVDLEAGWAMLLLAVAVYAGVVLHNWGGFRSRGLLFVGGLGGGLALGLLL